MRVSGILASKGSTVFMVGTESTVADALRRLKEHEVGALVVSDDGSTPHGLISERDIVRGLADRGAQLLDEPVTAIMSTPVLTCTPDESCEDLMRTMTNLRTRHLPVVERGEVRGLVSIGDVVKMRVTQLEEETRHLHNYIVTGR